MWANKNVLIISPEPWTHIHVSKHHYAIELVQQGATVFFLNPPTDAFKKSDTKWENLKVLDYKGFWSGLYRLPKFFRIINQRVVLRKLELLSRCTFDIVWSFDNSVFYDMNVFKDAFKISHIVDLNQDFQTARAATSADLCVGVIPKIVNRLKQYNQNTHLIGHGVHIYPCIEPVKLPGTGKLKTLYFGNLQMPHLDWQLFFDAVKQHSDVDFILLGSGHEGVPKELRAYKNVYLLDPVPSERLSCYMEAADILLLFYQKEYYESYASPHKMMEYLSSGKPIMASFTEDYADYCQLISMAKTNEEWLNELNKMVNNYTEFNCDLYLKQRQDFSKSNTYNKQLTRISLLIGG